MPKAFPLLPRPPPSRSPSPAPALTPPNVGTHVASDCFADGSHLATKYSLRSHPCTFRAAGNEPDKTEGIYYGQKTRASPTGTCCAGVGVGASLGSVFLFGKLADEILENESMALDTRLVEDAREMRSPTLDKTMSAATALGEPWALGAAGVLIGVDWLLQDRKADLITWASALVGGGLLNEILKRRFHRARPALKLRRAHATGYSFPSGHAMMTSQPMEPWPIWSAGAAT